MPRYASLTFRMRARGCDDDIDELKVGMHGLGVGLRLRPPLCGSRVISSLSFSGLGQILEFDHFQVVVQLLYALVGL